MKLRQQYEVALEHEVLDFWDQHQTFQKQVDQPAPQGDYSFFDGPPFATGTPHYGHILTGVIKDAIPRHWSMRGYRVERRFGWDCHGVPIESIVEKEYNVSGQKEIEHMQYNGKTGVAAFNAACRAQIGGYVADWEKIVRRSGRWIDMQNDYKTLDASFMESVWSVFARLWQKGYVYEANRIVPYSPKLQTALSNSEISDTYKDVKDPAVTVRFDLDIDTCQRGETCPKRVSLLAWTTTPWTLPSNALLAVHPEVVYVWVRLGDDAFILAQDRLPAYEKELGEAVVFRTMTGAEMVQHFTEKQRRYRSLFSFAHSEFGTSGYRVILADFVSTQAGTGIVHMAPAFGEDDYAACRANGLTSLYAPLNEKCEFVFTEASLAHATAEEKALAHALNGLFVKEADALILEFLKKQGSILRSEVLVHSYPHCPRTKAPIIYRAIPAWYVSVTAFRDAIVRNNTEQTAWVPSHIRDGRFGKWLANLRDWNVSRNRYWGNPLPIWTDENKKTVVCISSVQELYERNKPFGQILKDQAGAFVWKETDQPLDLHKEFMDEVLLQNPNGALPKKLLAVHGWRANIDTHNFWRTLEAEAKKLDVEYICPQFPEQKETYYHEWHSILEQTPVAECDTIVAHSLGTRVILQYLVEKSVRVRRLVLVSPFITGRDKQEIQRFLQDLDRDFHAVTDLVDEIIVLHSQDDTITPHEEGMMLGQRLKAHCISTSGFGHFLTDEVEMIASLVLYGAPLRRVPEVFDCWFESGSMPYGQHGFVIHPETQISDIPGAFPAQFICEGQDQTRGWFNSLMVLGTGLFDTSPFQNVIVNGLVLAEDGKKMSKSEKNYPDPLQIIEKHGMDTVRAYLLSSQAVECQDLRFSEREIEEMYRKVIRPWWNSFQFFQLYAQTDSVSFSVSELDVQNLLGQSGLSRSDRFLLASLVQTRDQVQKAFDSYYLQKASLSLFAFLETLSNWYVRRNRRRFWKSGMTEDKEIAYRVLLTVLREYAVLAAPILPFLSEYTDRCLSAFVTDDTAESVHLRPFPSDLTLSASDLTLIDETEQLRRAVSLGLSARAAKKIGVRQPLAKMLFVSTVSLCDEDVQTLKEELNIKEVQMVSEIAFAERYALPNARVLGPRFGKKVQDILQECKAGRFELLADGSISVLWEILSASEFETGFRKQEGYDDYEVASSGEMLVALDTALTPELIREARARDIIRAVQELRKQTGYDISDRIQLCVTGADDVLAEFAEFITTETLATLVPSLTAPDATETLDTVTLSLKK